MSLVTNSLITSHLIHNGLITNGLMSDPFSGEGIYEKLKGLDSPLIVSSNEPIPTEDSRPVVDGWCCEFDGVDDYIKNNNTTGWNLGSDPRHLHIKVYAKIESHGAVWQTLARFGDFFLFVYTDVSGVRLAFRDYGSVLYVPDANKIPYGTWVCYELITDDTDQWILYDGVEVARRSKVTTVASVDTFWSLGAYPNGKTPLLGKMAGCSISINDKKLKFNLQERSGTIAIDSSVANSPNNGTLMGGVTRGIASDMPYKADLNNLEGFSGDYENLCSDSEDLTSGWSAFHSVVSFDGEWTTLTSNSTASDDKVSVYNVADVNSVMYITLSAGTSNLAKVGLYNGSWAVESYDIVSGSGTVSDTSGKVKIVGLDSNPTVLRLVKSTTSSISIHIYPSEATVIGDSIKVKNIQIYKGNATTERPRFIETKGETVVSDTYLPVVSPTEDSAGNTPQYSGSVYPIHPRRTDAFAGVFDGVDDYVDCGVAATLGVPFSVWLKTPLSYTGVEAIAPCPTMIDKSITVYQGSVLTNVNGDALKTVELINTGKWVHLEVKADGSILLDGKIAALTDSSVLPIANNNGVLIFGARYNASTTAYQYFFKGEAFGFIYNGKHLPFSEGVGNSIHSTDGTIIGTIHGADTSTTGHGFWAGRQDLVHQNLDKGFGRALLFDSTQLVISDIVDTNVSNIDVSIEFILQRHTVKGSGSTRMTILGLNNDSVGTWQFFDISIFEGESTYDDSVFVSLQSASGTEFTIRYSCNLDLFVKNSLRVVVANNHAVLYVNGSLVKDEATTWFPQTATKINYGGRYRAINTSFNKFDGVIVSALGNVGDLTFSHSGFGEIYFGTTLKLTEKIIRIPASSIDPTIDVYGEKLTNPADPKTHDDAESRWDDKTVTETNQMSAATYHCPEREEDNDLGMVVNETSRFRRVLGEYRENLCSDSEDLTSGWGSARCSVSFDSEFSMITATEDANSCIAYFNYSKNTNLTLYLTLRRGIVDYATIRIVDSWVNDALPSAEVVSGNGTIQIIGGGVIVSGLDDSDTVIKLSDNNNATSGTQQIIISIASVLVGDSIKVKNIQIYKGNALTPRPDHVETHGTPVLLEEGITAIDRLLTYEDHLTGDDKTKALKYTEYIKKPNPAMSGLDFSNPDNSQYIPLIY